MYTNWESEYDRVRLILGAYLTGFECGYNGPRPENILRSRLALYALAHPDLEFVSASTISGGIDELLAAPKEGGEE